MKKNNWFISSVVFAFLSAISFFQINSAWSDANNFNGFVGWTGIGIITGLFSIYSMFKVSK